MFGFLPSFIKGTISSSLFALNTVFWCPMIYIFAFLRLLSPTKPLRVFFTQMCIGCAENWISINSFTAHMLHKITWDIQLPPDLSLHNSYLISSNHQSWVDIVILQHVFNRRIPFLRFFLKSELIWVPFLGPAWWALDFPFMKRYSAEYLVRHPEKRGEDLRTTKTACEKFRGSSISVLNFLEGTRFSSTKQRRQASPYKNLLKPKAGGIAFVVEAMGDQFDALLDVTIAYPDGVVSLWGLLSGQMDRVIVRVKKIEIPRELLGRNYHEDTAFRKAMQTFVRDLWDRKDKELLELLPSGR